MHHTGFLLARSQNPARSLATTNVWQADWSVTSANGFNDRKTEQQQDAALFFCLLVYLSSGRNRAVAEQPLPVKPRQGMTEPAELRNYRQEKQAASPANHEQSRQDNDADLQHRQRSKAPCQHGKVQGRSPGVQGRQKGQGQGLNAKGMPRDRKAKVKAVTGNGKWEFKNIS